MKNGWNLERRQRQAELIKNWRPWEKSTGPQTEKGKQASAQRGYKGGERKMLRELGQALREQRQKSNDHEVRRQNRTQGLALHKKTD